MARGYLLGKFPLVGKLLDWAEKQLEPIEALSQQSVARVVPGFDLAQVSGVLFSAVQRAISDRLRMTKPELAGDGFGLELRLLLIREYEAPGQQQVQRDFQKRWAYTKGCMGAAELRARLPE
eukprot:7870873-Alexandrium_andersonii.AAC.1